MVVEQVKTLKEKVYKFEFKKNPYIKIGDPLYFEAIESETDHGCEKDLVFDSKIRIANYGAVVVREVDIDGYISEEVEIFIGSTEKMIDVYLDGKYYGEQSIKYKHELGCDTARFLMQVDNHSDLFHTLSDGYYGHVSLYKERYGAHIYLCITEDAISFEEMNDRMKYLFKIKE